MGHLFYPIREVLAILEPMDQVIADAKAQIDTLAYDSRKIRHAGRSLFFALHGLRNGHAFVPAAYKAGVRSFVISQWDLFTDRHAAAGGNALADRHLSLTERFPDANFILVEDTLAAMQKLAAWHRKQFDYPVLAITGSNGKTIVKDWLCELLSPEYRIVRSPKSFNSQLGVALSLWQMDDSHNLAIIEAGISRTGEMERLAEMIRPDMAVLTNVGAAHQEGFSSFDQKKAEKFRLLRDAEQCVVPDDPRLQIHQVTIDRQEGRTAIQAIVRSDEDAGLRQICIPFTDRASIENALTCWSVMLMLGYRQSVISERMPHLQVMEMRLELKQGINRCTIIDDSYSNDLSSLLISLDLLSQQHQHALKTLILSDLPEIRGQEETSYMQMRDLIGGHHLDQLITVGPALAARQGYFPVREHRAFKDTGELLETLPALALADRSILIKGARKYTFEQISARLAAKTHETVMEIDMTALAHNIQQFKALIGPGVRLMVMVKAFSYGSGSHEVASLLQFHGIDYLAVAFADEGVALRNAGITLPIMVMSPDRSSFDTMLRHDLEPELFSFSILREWLDWLEYRRVREEIPVHLKFDTGMHRLGFKPEAIDELGALLATKPHVRVASVFSHFAASGDPGQDSFSEGQQALFESMTATIQKYLPRTFIRHMANTDAIIRHPASHYDMVRLGLGLYGLDAPGEGSIAAADTAKDSALTGNLPAIRLKTTITQIHKLPKGEAVGYGRHGKLSRDSHIATVSIGYADGYDRRFGQGTGRMEIRGRPVPTVGDICMDMCMLDVTDLPEIKEGDEVLVYRDLPAAAASIGTIPYELLVNISQRVKRVYYYR